MPLRNEEKQLLRHINAKFNGDSRRIRIGCIGFKNIEAAAFKGIASGVVSGGNAIDSADTIRLDRGHKLSKGRRRHLCLQAHLPGSLRITRHSANITEPRKR